MPGSSWLDIVNVIGLWVIEVAGAQTGPAGGAPAAPPLASGSAPPLWANLVPFIVLFGVMYFFMLRPQAKRHRQHQEFLSKLKRGDQVISGSGILGRVEGITDQFVTLEVADGVRVKFVKNQISGPVQSVTEVKS